MLTSCVIHFHLCLTLQINAIGIPHKSFLSRKMFHKYAQQRRTTGRTKTLLKIVLDETKTQFSLAELVGIKDVNNRKPQLLIRPKDVP